MARWNRLFSEGTTVVSHRRSYADCDAQGGIQMSSDAVSDTMGIRKPFPDVYPRLSLLRVSGYIMDNDVPQSGKRSSPFHRSSPRELSRNTVKHSLYAKDWLSSALKMASALCHPCENWENCLSNHFLVGLSCLMKSSLEKLTDTLLRLKIHILG